MPIEIQPITGNTLQVTAIMIDPISTEYRVSAVILDNEGKPLRSFERCVRVVDPETGALDVPEGVDFPVLYQQLKLWAYYSATKSVS